jgi:quinol monooxygenase YgiN/mannose-6-phosphate isomerase-like protein (cupin superfamily)
MTTVARYAKATAKPGEGDLLADLMLEVADSVRQAPGCDLYIVNRVPGERDTIWITELWAGQAELDGALELARASEDGLMGRVMEVVDAFDRIDLEPVGGVGMNPRPDAGWERVALDDVKDLAPGYGLEEIQAMRQATEPLGLARTGVSMQSIRPDQRQAFGHVHANAEETYIVLSGSGTLRVGDDEIPLAAKDAVRVAPTLTRAFEAGSDGLEYLAVGPRCKGDGEMRNGWWGDDA